MFAAGNHIMFGCYELPQAGFVLSFRVSTFPTPHSLLPTYANKEEIKPDYYNLLRGQMCSIQATIWKYTIH